MDPASTQSAPAKHTRKQTNPSSTLAKTPRTQQKDTSPTKPRRAKRRRAPAGRADFNVSFSRIKVSESNRVLRSGSKSDISSSYRNWSDVPCRPEKYAVSRDHSYSKASRRASPSGESSTSSSSTDPLKLVIDLSSNEDNSCELSCKEEDAFTGTHQDCHGSNDIKIIDFDDLELSNSCYRRRDSHSSNGHSAESRNRTTLSVQQTVGKATTVEGEGVGDADLNLLEYATFLEETRCMLASNAMQPPMFDNHKAASSPTYLDLDRHSNSVSSPPTSRHLASPVNFPSAGGFQLLGPVPTPSSIPEHFIGICPNLVSMGESRLPDLSIKLRPSNIPNFQTLMSALETSSTHYIDGKAIQFSNSFPTSGGSIERILSPVIPSQPAVQRNFRQISAISLETNNAMPESSQFDEQSGQHAECRIHLVDTPPSFTRCSQPTPLYLRSQPHRAGASGFMTQQDPFVFGVSHLKPRRTRRTRAQMQIYRQEMARKCSHRGKVNQRNPRNVSMEYRRRPYSHPNEFLYNGLSVDRFPSLHRTEATQLHNYSETYSVNEANFFAGIDAPQQYDAFSSFSHRVSEVRSFDPLRAALNSFSSSGNHQELHTHSAGSAPNPPSLMGNQHVHVMEMQTAFENVQQVPETNSRRSATAYQPFAQWEPEHLSANFVGSSDGL